MQKYQCSWVRAVIPKTGFSTRLVAHSYHFSTWHKQDLLFQNRHALQNPNMHSLLLSMWVIEPNESLVTLLPKRCPLDRCSALPSFGSNTNLQPAMLFFSSYVDVEGGSGWWWGGDVPQPAESTSPNFIMD